MKSVNSSDIAQLVRDLRPAELSAVSGGHSACQHYYRVKFGRVFDRSLLCDAPSQETLQVMGTVYETINLG